MKLPVIDPDRLEQECAADAEVLANLAENGDRSEVPRAVDVSFRGSEAALNDLAYRASEFEFAVLEVEPSEDGEPWLFLECNQKTDLASIRALTEKCLQIEIIFGIEYDGWGCVAQTGMTH